MDEDLESLASRLEESGDYRVLRRLKERDLSTADDESQKRIGLIPDAKLLVSILRMTRSSSL